MLFGNISQKTSKHTVIIQVAIQTQAFPVKFIAIFVANAAVKVFTTLFQKRIVMSSLSILLFIFFKVFAQYFFSFIKELTLCGDTDTKAISLQEKNDDRKNKITKTNTIIGSIFKVNKLNIVVFY
jgi:hypothetical protein